MATLPTDRKKQHPKDTLPWDALAVYSHEITLKKGNRAAFTKQLAKNIKRALREISATVSPKGDRIVVTLEPEHMDKASHLIAKVFGVAVVRPTREVPRNLAAMGAAALELYQSSEHTNASFGVHCKRIDKKFNLRSQEVEKAVGQAIVEATGAPVNLTKPTVPINFRIYKDNATLVGPDLRGVRGLPIGVTGRTLSLFSVGIDSAPAAWLMMRRGCKLDFIHFHIFPTAEPVRDTKIPKLLTTLLKPQGYKARLFLAPYHPFQMNFMAAGQPAGLELILFRRFMIRVADQLAKKHDLAAIITGDNLGQVASQTLENLAAIENVATRPIFQPLLAYDKIDIIKLAQDIGTYDLSTAAYKDCCSIASRSPITRPKVSTVEAAESAEIMGRAVEQALAEVEIWTVGE